MAPTKIGPFLSQSAMRHVPQDAVRSLWSRVRQAARPTGEDVRVVEQPIEHGGDRRGVAEELAPVLHGPVRGEQRGGALVTAHDDFESPARQQPTQAAIHRGQEAAHLRVGGRRGRVKLERAVPGFGEDSI